MSQLSVAVTVGRSRYRTTLGSVLLQVHHSSTGCNIIFNGDGLCCSCCITACIGCCPGSGDRSATIHYMLDSFTECYRYIGITVISCRYSGSSRYCIHTEQCYAAGTPLSTGCNIIFNGDGLRRRYCITACICCCPCSGDRSTTINYVLTSLKVTGTSVSQLSVAVTVGRSRYCTTLSSGMLQAHQQVPEQYYLLQ